jgi:poly(3-hydroxyalkanoate) synthetase
MKKNLTIYTRGVNYLSTQDKLSKAIVDWAFLLINTVPNYRTDLPDWLNPDVMKSERIITLLWKHDINPFSKRRAVKNLIAEINKYKNEYNIILVGTSLGGTISQEAAKHFDNTTISNIVLVGSINKMRAPELDSIKILNIYSTKDTLAKLVTRLLAPIQGSQYLEGKNVKNIIFDKARHDEFQSDIQVTSGEYKNLTISQVLATLIS